MGSFDDDLWQRVLRMPLYLLKEADARLSALITSEELRQKSLEDKAARYFINAAALLPITTALVSVMVKADGFRLQHTRHVDIAAHLLSPDVFSLLFLLLTGCAAVVVSARAMEVFKARDSEGVNTEDLVPADQRAATDELLYYRTQVYDKTLVARSLHKHNQSRGHRLRDAERITLWAFSSILIALSVFVLLLLFSDTGYGSKETL